MFHIIIVVIPVIYGAFPFADDSCITASSGIIF